MKLKNNFFFLCICCSIIILTSNSLITLTGRRETKSLSNDFLKLDSRLQQELERNKLLTETVEQLSFDSNEYLDSISIRSKWEKIRMGYLRADNTFIYHGDGSQIHPFNSTVWFKCKVTLMDWNSFKNKYTIDFYAARRKNIEESFISFLKENPRSVACWGIMLSLIDWNFDNSKNPPVINIAQNIDENQILAQLNDYFRSLGKSDVFNDLITDSVKQEIKLIVE